MSQVTWSGGDCDRTQEQETQQCHRLPGQVETVIGHKNRRPSNVTGYLVRWRLWQDTRTRDPAMSQVTWSGGDCDRTQEQETQQCHRLPGQVETVTGHKNKRPSNVTGYLVRWRLWQDTRTGDPAMSQVTWSGRDCDRTKQQETQQCHRLPGQVETVTGHKNRRSSNVTGYLVRWRLWQDTRTGDPAMSQVTWSGGDWYDTAMSQVTWSGGDCDRTQEQETQQCHRLPGQVKPDIGTVIGTRTGDPAMSQVTWLGGDFDRTKEQETQQCHRLPGQVETMTGQKNRRPSNVTGYLVR